MNAVQKNKMPSSGNADQGGSGPFFFCSFKKFVFASLCSFICLQAVYQLSGPEY